ncbi:hypothetical protein FQR65_LT18570 [Abscondita terminalis]|nr:hypothetical protein FQR65_LT18570 [Abscondita terminalis]
MGKSIGWRIIKLIESGGAALQERLARVLLGHAGIQILEGYGLTETSPVIAVNTWQPNGVRFGTVGKVLSNLDVKIGQDGEILVKGPSITAGYYKNEEATKEAIDVEGYFHTGDIGELSKDGFLKITDRKKEMFKTAGGKYVAPQVIGKQIHGIYVNWTVMVLEKTVNSAYTGFYKYNMESGKAKAKKGWLKLIINRPEVFFSMVLGLGFLLIASLMINGIIVALTNYFGQYFESI